MSHAKYSSLINLKEIGITGLKQIQETKVLVLGAGGLGCPALLYLAASGFIHMGVVDFDQVSISNLSRQILYAESDLGKLKVDIVKEKLLLLHPSLEIETFAEKFTQSNGASIINKYDIILDCSDNMATRYVLDAICTQQAKPWIYAAVGGWEGMVSRFGDKDGSSFTYIFQTQLEQNEPLLSCAEQGILGSTCAIAASMQVNDLILWVLKKPGLQGKIFSFNLLTGTFRTLKC